MLRPLGFVAVGFAGVMIAKLLWGFIALPMLGFLLGIMFFVLKIIFIGLFIWLGYKLFCKLTDRPSEA